MEVNGNSDQAVRPLGLYRKFQEALNPSSKVLKRCLAPLKFAGGAFLMQMAILFSVWPNMASALDFEVRYTDNRPIFPPTIWVDMTGAIEPGDTQRFLSAIQPYMWRGATDMILRIDSPGGNLFESIQLGEAISGLPLTTTIDVGVGGDGGVCASACVNVYLGADYRFLSENSKIGVHQFSMEGSDVGSDEAISISQGLSALIIEHIRTMRADPAFFSVMVSAHADEIFWVPLDTLENLRVVTYGIFSENVEYRNVNGSIALYIEQVSRVGSNAITLICSPTGLVGVFNLNEPELSSIGSLGLYVDGVEIPLPDFDVIERGDYRFRAIALFPNNVLTRLSSARSLGARAVSPEGDIFFGFQGGVRDPRISETARGCQSSQRDAAPVMTRVEGIDFTGGDLTRSGHRGISFAECESICRNDPRCVAISYVVAQRWCWPKGSINAINPNPGVVSAYLE